MIESFSFEKGINIKKDRLFLEQGELYSCSGFNLDVDGRLETREARQQSYLISSDPSSSINGIHRFDEDVYSSSRMLCPGRQSYFNNIYHRAVDGTTYTRLDLLAGNIRPCFADYEVFVFVADGGSRRAYIGARDYEWGIKNPVNPPAIVQGAGGNPDGEYNCYYTYYIRFPNDKYVETGPSPVSTITVASAQVYWQRIPSCPYEGAGLTVMRRLYRTVSGVIYLVTTVPDNTTGVYSDNVTDATLQLSPILGTEGYTTPPDYITDLEIYLQRVFAIKKNKLYWSEAYSPFSFKNTSDITVTKEDEDLVSVINWGDQLYLVSTEQWYRLQGNNPDTWAIKRTFTDSGIVNKYTLKHTKYGLIGLWNDGIYMFDGSINKNITELKLGTSFFKDLDDLSVCYAEFDGGKYYLYYASSGTTLDSCLVIDFAYFPEIRLYHTNFIPSAYKLYKPTNTPYFTKNRYEWTTGGTETIPIGLSSGDKAFGAIMKRKCLDYLYYDIDTNGQDVDVDIYVDDENVQTLTLNTSSRTRKRSQKLKAAEGYRFRLDLNADNAQDMVIYSPWALESTPVGE